MPKIPTKVRKRLCLVTKPKRVQRVQRQRQLTAMVGLRLRTDIGNDKCTGCNVACRAFIQCANPRCKQLFTKQQLLDLWEVYDDCAICPTCDKPMPSYTVVYLCPNDIPEERRQEFVDEYNLVGV